MKMLISLTYNGRNTRGTKRFRDIVSQTIARSGTASPRNEIPYYTIAQFTNYARRYAWSKLSNIAALQGNRATPYRESIPQLDMEGNPRYTATGKPIVKVVTRKATFDTNLIDDCVQEGLFYWIMLGYEPHAAMFFGTRHYLTATQRLKVTGNSEKAIDLAPSVEKYEDKLTLKVSDTGELAMLEMNLDMPNFVKMVFEPLPKDAKVKGTGRGSNRLLSKQRIARKAFDEREELVRNLKDWFRDAPTAHEQAAMDKLKEQRRDWNAWVKANRESKKPAHDAAVARLAYGPPTYEDYLTIFLYREGQAKLKTELRKVVHRSWNQLDFGFTGPHIMRNKLGVLPGYSADALRELRIGKPRMMIPDDEVVMTGCGMGL